MATSIQGIRKLVVVLAMAIVLLGGLVTPAGAAPRSYGVGLANEFIFNCTWAGGEPVVVMDSTGENLTVMCRYPDGRVAVCQFLPVVKECQWVTPLKASRSSGSAGTAVASK